MDHESAANPQKLTKYEFITLDNVRVLYCCLLYILSYPAFVFVAK